MVSAEKKAEGMKISDNPPLRITVYNHRLNMELDLHSLLGLPRTAAVYSLAETPQLPPPPSLRIWAQIRGRYWSEKIDDISL